MIDCELVSVLGQVFRVEYRDLAGDEADDEDRVEPPYGKTFVVERLIVVTPRTPPERRDEVLAHELTHAAFGLCGLTTLLGGKLEEAVCTVNELVWVAMATGRRKEKKKVGPTPGGSGLKEP